MNAAAERNRTRSNEENVMRTTKWNGRKASALAGAALAAFALAGCAKHEARPASDAPAGPAVTVQTDEVVRTGEGAETLVPATLQARNRAALSARIPASVIDLPFRVGDRVAAGDVVVRLDDAAFQSAVAAAEAAAHAAETDLARTKALLAKGAATQRELDQATAGAAGARAMLSGARDNLAYAALRAPFAGSVASRNANLGDVVAPGRPLIEIEGAGGLEIRATVESDVLAQLAPGLKLAAHVDGQAAPVEATVRTIAPAGDPATHRFEVKADIGSAPGLRSGLFARLAVPSPSAEARLLVPAGAVFRRGGLFGVYVVTEGRARLRWVAVGETAGGLTEIRSGVVAGERVVIGPTELSDGAPVEEKH
jgi:RND family efflux transporter MFP subunit